jgi:hypothetical protein
MIANRCVCGAVTVTFDDGASTSMPKKKFKETFPKLKPETGSWGNCNYCVNHWGIDLCRCGSGKKTNKCNCKAGLSSQELGKKKFYLPWA